MAKTSTNKFNIDVNQAIQSVDKLRKALDSYNKNVKGITDSQEKLKASTQSFVTGSLAQFAKSLDKSNFTLASLNKNLSTTEHSLADLVSKTKDVINFNTKAEQTFKKLGDSAATVRKQIKDIASAVESSFIVNFNKAGIQVKDLETKVQSFSTRSSSEIKKLASTIDASLGSFHNLQGMVTRLGARNPFAAFAGGFGTPGPRGPISFGGPINSPAIRPPAPSIIPPITNLQPFLSTNTQLLESYNRLTPAMRQNHGVAAGLNREYGLLGLSTRVLVVAQLHRVINLVTTAMSDAVRTAQQFSVRIAEIQTIQGRTVLTTQEWAQRLRGLSDSFGIPILQAAEGAYQAISNQVVHAGNATAFLREETKLAKTAVATLDQAVSATSTVLNAFNFSLADTHNINAKLFEAVNIGRFRLEELGSQFGRTSILARQLGVSLDEELGALTLMTRKGLQADVALTLLTNVFNSLLKPSKELSGWLSSIGFNSGQAAIRALGFTNVMGKLAAEADKTADGLSDIAQKFQDLRALTGAGALTGFFNELTGDIDRLKNSANSFDKAIDTTFKSLGQRATVQLQQAKNAFVDQFGTPVLRTFVQVSESIGGLDVVIDRLVNNVRSSAIAFITYRSIVASLTLAHNLMATSTFKNILLIRSLSDAYRVAEIALLRLAAAGGTLLLATATITFFVDSTLKARRYGTELEELAHKTRQLAEETSEKRLKGNLDRINKSFDELSTSVKKSSSAIEIFISNTQSRLNKLADSYEKAFKKLSTTIHSTFAEVEKVTAKSVADSLRAAEKLERTAERARDRVRDIKDKEEGRKIEGLLTGEDSLAKVDILEREKTRIHAAAVAARAKDEEESATHLFELVNKLAEKQKDILTKLREDALRERDTESHIRLRTHPVTGLPILNRRGVATLRRSRETVHAPDDAAATALLARLNALEAERTRLVAERVRLETEAATRATEAAKKAADDAKVKEKVLEDLKSLLSALETAKSPTEFSAGVTKAGGLVKAAGLSPEAQIALLRDLKKQEVLIHRQAEIDKLNATIEAERKKVDVITKAIDDANAKNKEATTNSKQSREELIKGTEVLIAQVKDFRNSTQFLIPGKGGPQVDTDFTKGFDTKVGNIQSLLNTLKQGKATATDVADLNAQLKELVELSQKFNFGNRSVAFTDRRVLGQIGIAGLNNKNQFTTTGRPGAPSSLSIGGESIAEQVRKLQQAAAAAQNANISVSKAQFELGKLERQLRELSTEAAKVPLAEINAARAAEDWARRSNESSRIINNGLSGTIAALEEIRLRILRMPALPVPIGGPAASKAFGGSFAFGRNGIDSVHALLAPGEIVMTQSVSRAFGPFLHALNNTTSQNKSHGGSVTFGDINITAAQGSTDVQVRDIATKLQRLARRGMFSI